MAATTKIWANGIAPTCEDVDLNGFKEENNNLITGSSQTLDTADRDQTHKAVAYYSAVGDFYIDSGIANAYVLSPAANRIVPLAYVTGMKIRFLVGNNNTGASTVNVGGLGVVSLIANGSGLSLPNKSLVTTEIAEAYYNGTEFVLTSTTQQIQSFRGNFDTVTGGADIDILIAHTLNTSNIDILMSVTGINTAGAVGFAMALDAFQSAHSIVTGPAYTGVFVPPAAPGVGNIMLRFRSDTARWNGIYQDTIRSRPDAN